MMIKIEAIVREEVFEDVKEALNAIDVNGITVSQVMGCGAQRGYKKLVRGTEVDVVMQPKIKFEIQTIRIPDIFRQPETICGQAAMRKQEQY